LKKPGFAVAVVFCAVAIVSHMALAGEATPPKVKSFRADSWRIAFAPYFWTTHLSGDLAVKGRPAEVDMDFTDIFKLTNFAAMIHVEAHRGRVRLMTDVMYLSLGKDAQMSRPDANLYVNANSDQVVWEFGGGYLVSGLIREGMERSPLTFEVIGGGRYSYMDLELNFQAEPDATEDEEALAGIASDSKSWVDPFIGARARLLVAKKWDLGLRADIGGFGVGSQLTVNAVARVSYAASDVISLTLGFRVYDVDVEDGGGSELFVYDTTMMGPLLAVTFNLK
jgi:hypothetical protein